ncbi:unnamed protein product [Orchesella dallaii]|uniref:Uncharacterized protein n=1 Tax=Orchesella dallaii TaxID=48710 RepID=A0ABP1RVW2_9HEXA
MRGYKGVRLAPTDFKANASGSYNTSNGNFEPSATLIDHAYVSNKSKFNKADAIEFFSSDYHLIYTVYKSVKRKLGPKVIDYRCVKKIIIKSLNGMSKMSSGHF